MSADPSTEVKCPVCGAVMANAIELEEHMEVHAEQRAEGEPYQTWHACAFCGKKFATPEELRDHHRTAHGK
jgi:phage FluMu protein Com